MHARTKACVILMMLCALIQGCRRTRQQAQEPQTSDRAPVKFDIVGFLNEIKDSAVATYTNPTKLWAYLKARAKGRSALPEAAALNTSKEYDALKHGSEGEKEVAQNLERIANNTDVDQTEIDRIKKDEKQPAAVRLTLSDVAEEIRLMKSWNSKKTTADMAGTARFQFRKTGDRFRGTEVGR